MVAHGALPAVSGFILYPSSLIPDLEQSLLDLVNRPGYKPAKPRVLAQRLGCPKDQVPELKRAVKRLVRRGQILYGGNHLVRPAAGGPQANRVVGVFHRAQKGYGFVRPKAPLSPPQGDRVAPSRAAEAQPPQDIYIPAKWTHDAATGDVVLVGLQRERPRGPAPRGATGPRGQILDVIQRQTRQFVGTYFEEQGAAYVEVDGAVFAQPIAVGDPGAKNARPDDKVVLEMVRFPSPLYEGEGVIIEVLGPQGRPGVDTLSILREFNLPEQFAGDALDEARQQAEGFDESLGDRLDLTGQTVVTIDPPDARDFDDAISLERLAGGAWRLGVHIADVGHFVRPRTALDREAQHRGTSVYLPDRVLPMLPELISNGLASLQPQKVRYTQSVLMDFAPEGLRTDVEFHAAAIKSSKRLSYDQVDAFLADRPAWRRKLGPKVHDLLGRMHELAMILRRRRMARGALVLAMPEVKIDLDAEGRVTGAHMVRDTESHQIIEEFMLAANEAVAERLHAKGIALLRRVHEPPREHKLRALAEFVRALGLEVRSLQDRFELQRLLDEVRGTPHQHAVHYAALRAMQRAVYSPKEEGHYALASPCYCHFTSPIRRYPDLVVHRLLDEVLSGRKPRAHLDQLVLLGQHCSDREQRADAAERDLTKLKLLAYLADRVGMEMDALVTGVEGFGLFVEGIELPAEGLIHADALADDYYRFDRATHTLWGRRSANRYRLGDRLRVAVARVDLGRRELDFRLVESGMQRADGGSRRAESPRTASGPSAAEVLKSPRTVSGGLQAAGRRSGHRQAPRGYLPAATGVAKRPKHPRKKGPKARRRKR
ncbi:MAG: ribonuclease R [Thermoguttaceae bacterium]|jgi:ribonuclease R